MIYVSVKYLHSTEIRIDDDITLEWQKPYLGGDVFSGTRDLGTVDHNVNT